jgi:hypothetical protein
MTKQEYLQRAEELTFQIEQLERERLAEKTKLKLLITDTLVRTFNLPEGAFFNDSRYSRATSHSIYMNDEDGVSREILTIYLDENWLGSKDGSIDYITGIKPSYYTTSVDSTFELRRLVVLGAVGKTILDKGKELLAEVNRLFAAYVPLIDKNYNRESELEREFKDIERILMQYKKQAMLNKLYEEGLTFKAKVEGRYPTLEFSAGRSWRNVKHIKAVPVGKVYSEVTVTTPTYITSAGRVKTANLVSLLEALSHKIEDYEQVAP